MGLSVLLEMDIPYFYGLCFMTKRHKYSIFRPFIRHWSICMPNDYNKNGNTVKGQYNNVIRRGRLLLMSSLFTRICSGKKTLLVLLHGALRYRPCFVLSYINYFKYCHLRYAGNHTMCFILHSCHYFLYSNIHLFALNYIDSIILNQSLLINFVSIPESLPFGRKDKNQCI